MFQNTDAHHDGRARVCATSLLLILFCLLPLRAYADEIRHGVLQLRWGDAEPGTASLSPRVEVWLDAGPGQRYRLDVDQARRAAGDLYALSNRRVAVSYVPAPRFAEHGMERRINRAEMMIDAIVPVDRPSAGTPTVSVDGRATLSLPLQGNTRWVTLMCKFGDVDTEQKPREFFQSQYGNAPGQLGHFWSEVSYGNINLAGSDAYGWYTLPRPRSAYVELVSGRRKVDLSLLFTDCTARADPDVDFNGIHGINLMFNHELDGYAWGGGACATLDGVYICPRSTWNPPWSFSNLAAMAHEMGHGYGLPHSNNSDGDGDTFDNPWDLMSDAWRMANSDGTYGLLPKHINMFQRQRLGWVTAARTLTIPAEDVATREVVLAAASAPNRVVAAGTC